MTASFRFSKTRQNGQFLAFLINFCPLKMLNETFSVIFKHCGLQDCQKTGVSEVFLKNCISLLSEIFFVLSAVLFFDRSSHFYFCIPLGLRAHLWKVLSLLPVFPMSKKGCQLGAKCRFHKNWQWQTTLLRKWPSLISLKIHSSFTHYPKCPYFVRKSVKMENVTFLVRLCGSKIWILTKKKKIEIWTFYFCHNMLK